MKSSRAQLNAATPSQLTSVEELVAHALGSVLAAETPTHLRQTRSRTLSLVHHRQAYGDGHWYFQITSSRAETLTMLQEHLRFLLYPSTYILRLARIIDIRTVGHSAGCDGYLLCPSHP